MASNFLNDLLNKPIEPLKKWSERSLSGGSFSNLCKDVRHVLDLISGNDTVSMLKFVLSSSEIDELASKYINVIKTLSVEYNTTAPKDRHNLIRAFRENGFSIYETRALGWNASFNLWHSCGRKESRSLGGASCKSESLISDLYSHLDSMSNISSDRTVQMLFEGVLQDVNVRYMKAPVLESYNLFPRQNEISLSSYYNHITKQYKRPHRLSDLCDYCEYATVLNANILDFLSIFSIHVEDNKDLNCHEIINQIRNSDSDDEDTKQLIISKLHDLRELQFHQHISLRQRNSYNAARIDANKLKTSHH